MIDLSTHWARLDFGLMLRYLQFYLWQVKDLALFNPVRLNPSQIRLTVTTVRNRVNFDVTRLVHWLEPMPDMAYLTAAGLAARLS